MAERTPGELLSAGQLRQAIARSEDGGRPRFRALAAAIGDAVASGDLPVGSRLPTDRSLAAELGVARGTVVAALELLRSQGVIERRQGSGTWVADAPALAGAAEPVAGLRSRSLAGRLVGPASGVIDLGVSLLGDLRELPDDAFDLDPRRLERLSAGHGYHPLGLPALRSAIAEVHSAEGLATEPGQVIVTGGAQHALALVARLLIEPGDAVAVESPTYPAALDAFARSGASFRTVGADAAGAQPESVRRVLSLESPKVLYLVPTAHNPTGTVMPAARRRDVAAAVAGSEVWLVEDDSLRWSVFSQSGPPLPIGATAGERSLLVGSLSKVLWGGLRVGWIRAAAPVVERLGRLAAADGLGTSALSQVVALGLLDDLDRIAERRRRELAAQADLMAALLAVRLPGWTLRPPEGGLSLWVRLGGEPTAVHANSSRGTGEEFARSALAHGVGVLPGSVACVDDSGRDHIRISFAHPPEVLASAAERLGAAWAGFVPGDAPVGRQERRRPALG